MTPSTPDVDLDDPTTYGIDTEVVAVTSPYGSIPGVDDVDDIVCVCARNDYLPTDEWIGDSTFDEIMGSATPEGLIDHLLRPPGHYGPFEHPTVVLAIGGVSRVTMAQLTRHRVGISFDIQSSRYTMPDQGLIEAIVAGDDPLDTLHEYVVVPKLAYELDRVDEWLERYLEDFVEYFDEYERARDAGHPDERAKEDCRYLLPKGLRVNIVMSANLRTLMHIADMRAAADAQWEIRALTDSVLETAETVAPISMAKYREYRLDNNLKHRLAPDGGKIID